MSVAFGPHAYRYSGFRVPLPAGSANRVGGPQPRHSTTHGRFRRRRPIELAPLVGRDREVAELIELLARPAIVTLTGPPGVGKSRLALEVGTRLARGRSVRVAIVNLASGSGRDRVAAAVEVAARMDERADAELVVVLDDCDSMIDVAAEVAEVLGGEGVRVIATAREPLGAQGEIVRRVAALDAERLFLFGPTATGTVLAPTPDDLPHVSAICRTVDGIPREAEPSYEGLTRPQRVLLERAGKLSGWFSADEVAEGAGGGVQDDLNVLVEKSLVEVETQTDTPRYRLLTIVRWFVSQKARALVPSDDQASPPGVVGRAAAVVVAAPVPRALPSDDERSAPRARRATAWEALTPKERQVAELTVRGLKSAAIALNLHITEGTVKTHLRSIFAKLGVRNRVQLATCLAQGGAL